jgi:hypothetical protein
MAELAVKGCKVKITSGQQAVTIQIKTSPSSNIDVGGKGVYFGDIDVALATISQENLVCSSGTITIKGTAANVLAGSDKAVQKGDNATDTFTFTDSSSGATTDLPVTVEITDAGQTDVIAL